ncbi:DNA-binding transcriptional regulator, GntR family [Sinosporangium album]|uniref:DNA-binding transcriptional regulator, GntR family n=1 Tax=Sinosporangium album TaxID=504805 RepID=A0A1G8FN74_9ACTN|nr:winged helix-turn-helix domain-containing protein [Sinosporangium album]SDH83582.1 DNA-binding transcriptional regulator, GntR family [Sinosporangium album]
MPPYRQIANQIKADIQAGRLAPGQPVPSEAELCGRYGVCRVTVRRAMALLRAEETVYTVRAEGSYVGPRTIPRHRPWRRSEQVAAGLREQIRTGRLRPGDRLPSESCLTAEHGVARDTVRTALALLRHEQWVYTVACKGTFVADRTEAAGNDDERHGPLPLTEGHEHLEGREAGTCVPFRRATRVPT